MSVAGAPNSDKEGPAATQVTHTLNSGSHRFFLYVEILSFFLAGSGQGRANIGTY